jgi:hypothetical protein
MSSGVNSVEVQGLRTEFEALREKTKTDIAALEERNKEREPSLLGAIRTLVADYQAWMRGDRDFPRSAVLGAVFAYLRPRMILVLGSFAAVLVAILQIWMLARQNSLIEQQNTLIEKQGHALAAQTTVALMAGLDQENVPRTSFSILAAFGDIGLDSLLIAAQEPEDRSGSAARRALIMALPRFTDAQHVAVLRTFFEAHAEEIRRSVLVELTNAVSPQSSIALLEQQPRAAFVPRTMSAVSSLEELLRALIKRGFDPTDLKRNERLDFVGDVGRMYVMYFMNYAIDVDVLSAVAADRAASMNMLEMNYRLHALCTQTNVDFPAGETGAFFTIARVIEKLRAENASVSIGSVVATVVKRSCKAAADIPEREIAAKILGSAPAVDDREIALVNSAYQRMQ